MAQGTVVARESPLSLGCWFKVACTLGLYLLWWYAKRLEVTSRAVVYRAGILGKQERTIPLDKVQDVTVSYGVVGRLLNYGTIRIESSGASGTEIALSGFTNPDKIKRAILSR